MAVTREKAKLTRTGRGRFAALFALMLFSAAALSATPLPNIPEAAKGEQCVEETNFMRKNHMELLLHQRDETMHQGIRTKKHSLKQCLSCHVVKGEDQQPVTAADPRHFCSACHQYAAVKVDCFQCHASTPSEEELKNSALDSPLPGMKITALKDMSQ